MLLVDTSSDFSWIASPPVKSNGFKPTYLQRDVLCRMYRQHELTGQLFTATMQLGRTGVEGFRFLSATIVMPAMELIDGLDGSLGLAPSGLDTFWDQGGCKRPGSESTFALSIEHTTRESAEIRCQRSWELMGNEGFTAFNLASRDRWSMFVDNITMGGVTLCDRNCEVSFELGLVNAFFPEAYSGIISLIWNVDFHWDFNTFVLQRTALTRYAAVSITVEDLVFTWPTQEHAYDHTTPLGERVLLSSIRFHDKKYFALGTDFLHRIKLRMKSGRPDYLEVAKNSRFG
ncbi:hypothetical protein CRM22_001537 [Opisthorchis felineus]|uniref:Peptidase A1 domain-containing protein n=1 Tax=Opisthorchis felineus TaxID=147828 RepID=A0A4S2MAD4_OPIFE|nr:hypothetical protein CRM22_001537 [Opisthorchis felineus]